MTQPKTASKFTPGPWTLELVGTGSDAYKDYGFWRIASDENLYIAEIDIHSGREADAWLITKAPDMYELLEAVDVLLSDSEVRHAISEVGEQAQVHKLLRMTGRIKAAIDGEG